MIKESYHLAAASEDLEFIVRLPQIIAADLYEGPIVKIFAPLEECWKGVISPAAQKYVGSMTLAAFV